jgi:phosphotriesterase-related protein
MPTVATARGPVDTADLGFTLAHEHLFVLSTEFQLNYPDLWDRQAGVRRAVAELQEAHRHGVRTIVDMTVIGQGRNIDLVRRVAEQVEINIVLATGVYTTDGLPPFLRFRGPGEFVESRDPVVDLLMSDITRGIGGTELRAGVVKFACESDEPDHAAIRMTAAMAEVHQRTGVPVAVHSNPDNGNGLPLARLLIGAGVPADRVVIGHAGDSADSEFLRALADTGCWIGFDRFGMTALAPDEQRIAGIVDLVERGHAGQLLLSQDNASHIDYLTEKQRVKVYPHWSYLELVNRIIPELRERGISGAQIDVMTRVNPARFLTGTSS